MACSPACFAKPRPIWKSSICRIKRNFLFNVTILVVIHDDQQIAESCPNEISVVFAVDSILCIHYVSLS